MNAPPVRVVVFAKAPRPGQAKTRLIPALGADGAARLAARLIDDTLARVLAAGIGPVSLRVTPDTDPYWQPYRARADLDVWPQGDGDLGARMDRASRQVIASGASMVLIGTDCPALRPECLVALAAALDTHDAALVPALDGGYVAIALRRYDPAVYAGLPWSTDAVARLTIERITALGWRLATFPPLPDLDTPEDLARLPARLSDSRLSG